MARNLTQADVKKILLNILSDCKECLICNDCKIKRLEDIVKELEEIKESKSLNFLGNDFLDNQLPILQKSLCTASSVQREKLIRECIKSISSDNKRQKNIATKKHTKKSFLEKLFG